MLYPNNEKSNDQTSMLSERNIFMHEINPHTGLLEYSDLLNEQINNVYSVFEDWKI